MCFKEFRGDAGPIMINMSLVTDFARDAYNPNYTNIYFIAVPEGAYVRVKHSYEEVRDLIMHIKK